MKFLAKILVLGVENTGKTSLISQYVDSKFSESYKSTIGADFSRKVVDVDGKSVTLQIWDTAGQERFQSLGVAFYRGTDGCMLVYDVTRRSSFEALSRWIDAVLLHGGISADEAAAFPIVVCGNKADLPGEEREISEEEAQAWCKQETRINIVDFFETSAKTARNVEKAFRSIAKVLAKRMANPEAQFSPPESERVVIRDDSTSKAENSSCAC